MEKISVAVRFRPSTGPETSEYRQWRVEDNRISLHRPLGTPISGVSFAFGAQSYLIPSFAETLAQPPQYIYICFADHVFDQTTTNATVYDRLTKPIIQAAVDGFNGISF